jgi:hypothetical protein
MQRPRNRLRVTLATRQLGQHAVGQTSDRGEFIDRRIDIEFRLIFQWFFLPTPGRAATHLAGNFGTAARAWHS